MKQRFKRKKVSPFAGILIILGLLFGVVTLAAVIYVATDAMKAAGLAVWYMPYVEYVLLIAAGIFIVRRWMTEYEYDVIDDELIIDRYIGRRARNLLHIKLSSVVSIGPGRPDVPLERLTFQAKSGGVTYIVYRQNGRQKGFYFSPSDALAALIAERTPQR